MTLYIAPFWAGFVVGAITVFALLVLAAIWARRPANSDEESVP